MRSLIAAALVAIGLTTSASAAIYPQCQNIPTISLTAPTGKLWYFDPVNGTTPAAGADGSKAHPYDNVQAVSPGAYQIAGYPRPLLSTVPYDHLRGNAVTGFRFYSDGGADPTRINPGDTIVLESGNYGDWIISPDGRTQNGGIVNSRIVSVVPDTGAKPIISGMQISGTNGWYFNGITVQGLDGKLLKAQGALVKIGDSGPTMPVKDIIFNWNTVQGLPALPNPAWSQTQYQTVPPKGILVIGSTTGSYTSCIQIAQNKINFTSHALGLTQAGYVSVQANTINHFTGDGIDLYSVGTNYTPGLPGGGPLNISGNLIENRIDSGNGDHPDCIQFGVNGTSKGTDFGDVTVSGNRCVANAENNLPFPGDIQGISIFNLRWHNLQVDHNVVVSHSCYGYNFGSAVNSTIDHNTAVWDGAPWTTAPGCPGLRFTLPLVGPNVVSNNVVTGQLFQPVAGGVCDPTVVLTNNVVLAAKVGSGWAKWGSAVCSGGKFWNGVGDTKGQTDFTINQTIDPSTQFSGYSPPANFYWNPALLPTLLKPAAGSLLVGVGAY